MWLLPIILLFATCGSAQCSKTEFFSYPIHKKTLGNGLDVVVIETPEFKDVLSYNMMILAGSRNETEKGQSGLAHLFEHILFRHRYGGVANGYTQAIRQLGAHNNAWTDFDATYYHPLTFRSNLERLAELEASRFTTLDFEREAFPDRDRRGAGRVPPHQFRPQAEDGREDAPRRCFRAIPTGTPPSGSTKTCWRCPSTTVAGAGPLPALLPPDQCGAGRGR